MSPKERAGPQSKTNPEDEEDGRPDQRVVPETGGAGFKNGLSGVARIVEDRDGFPTWVPLNRFLGNDFVGSPRARDIAASAGECNPCAPVSLAIDPVGIVDGGKVDRPRARGIAVPLLPGVQLGSENKAFD